MFLNLIVLRAKDIERLGRFYEALGLSFVRERHGSGPEHLTARTGEMTFEIYPCVQQQDTRGIRIGFNVDHPAERLAIAVLHGATIVTALGNGPWGERAVIADPEGHIVELVSNATVRPESTIAVA